MEQLIICGLGVRIPEETTLESLQALGDCRVVYTDLVDEKARKWLAGYCKALKRPASAAEVLKDAKGGGVGLAVWGHPQFSSRLARETELAAQKAGTAYRAFGAISPIGSVFARSVSFLGGDYGYQGIQAYSLEALAENPKAASPVLPLVLYGENATGAQWRAALDSLAATYPAAHEARAFPAAGPETQARFAALRPEGNCVVLIPPDPAKAAPMEREGR